MDHKSKKIRQQDFGNSGRGGGMPSGKVNPRSPLKAARPVRMKFWTPETRRVVAVCAFLVLAVALVFGRAVEYGFVNYDDEQYVYENPQVKSGLTIEGILWAFTTDHFNNWHPLTWISHMLDCQVYGLQAGGHHLTSVMLHAAAAVLLFLLLWRMTGLIWRSAIVAALFAVHPLRVESVAWISERKDVLSGLLFMLTLWAYVDYARRPFSMIRYLPVVICFALGLMAKPMLVTLPFVLLLLDFWPMERHGMTKTAGWSLPFSRRVILEKIPLLVMTAVSCLATFLAQGKAVVDVDTIPIVSRVANALVSYMAYVGDSIYPVGLAVFYPHPGNSLPTWKVVGSMLALTGISSAAILWRRRFPYLFVGWFWYVGMLVPVIGVVQVGLHSMADRYTYLPQIGLCLALIWGVAELTNPFRYRLWVRAVAAVLAMAVLMGMAWRQTSYWRDSQTLWTRALDCTSANYIAHNNLGNILYDRGQIDASVFHYRKALEIKPDYIEAHYNLGNIQAALGKDDEAVAHYQKSLEIHPDYARAHNNLGNVLAGQGKMDDAIRHFQRALQINPDFVEAHNNLGTYLAGLGRIDDAIVHFQKALIIRPDYAESYNNLGIVLARLGQMNNAIAYYRKALEIKYDNAKFHNNLGNALASIGQLDAAVFHFKTALSIKPNLADTHFNLGVLLANQGKVNEAIGHFKKVLEINPNDTLARKHLETALQHR